MRSFSTQEGKVLSGGRLNTPARLRVRDPGGTLQDLTALFGWDWLQRWDVDEDVDQPVAQLQCSLSREIYLNSMSALRSNTRPNLITGSYAPLLAPGAEVLLDVAVLPEGIAASSGDWRTVFDGEIDRVELGSNPMSFTARDLGGRLQDLWIQVDREYGSPSGVAIETVIQDIIDRAHGTNDKARLLFGKFLTGTVYAAASGTTPGDRVTPTTHNGYWYRCTTAGTSAGSEPTWPTTIGSTVTSNTAVFTCAGLVPTLYTPTSPSFLITTYNQQPQSVLEAIRSMALNNIGWDVRYRWRDSSSQFELTLSVPDRTTTTSLYTWDADHYYAVPDFSIDRSTVRSQIDVVYSDAADLDAAGVPKRKTVTRTDKASMDKWSGGLPRWSQLAEDATSQIDTGTEAGALADNALSDLKDPKAEAAYDLVLFPFAQLGDLYTFQADNVLYDSDQKLAVTGIRHSGAAGGATRTTVKVRGTPVVAVEQWLRIEAGEIVPAKFQGPQAPTGVAVVKVQGGLSVTWVRPNDGTPAADFEVHASTSSSFTPDDTTLRATTNGTGKTLGDLEPGVTYYIQVVPRDRLGNRGTATAEVSTAAGYTPPRAMTPQVTYERLPVNPDFEQYTDGTGSPPDTWTDNGTWGVSLTDSTSSVQSGGHAVHFSATGPFDTHPSLSSQLFPVVAGELWELALWIKTPSSNGGCTFEMVWYSDLNTTTGSPASLGVGSGHTSFTRFTATGAAPAGAKYARVVIFASTNEECWVDNVNARSLGPDWVAPSFGTNWGNGGSGYGLAATRDMTGRVWWRGTTRRSSGAVTTAATAAAGLRPGNTEYFPVWDITGGTVVQGSVDASGNVVIGPITNNHDYSFSGVSYQGLN